MRSQWQTITYQEWRNAQNSIEYGWSFYPKINKTCIEHNGLSVDKNALCEKESYLTLLSGTHVFASFQNIKVAATLENSMWIMATLFSLLVLLPLTGTALLLRIPLRKRAEQDLLAIIMDSDIKNRKLSEFEKEAKKLTEKWVEASKHEAIARMTQMLAHDVRKPFSIFKSIIQIVEGTKDPALVRKFLSQTLPELNQAMASVEGMIQDVIQVGSNAKLDTEDLAPEALIKTALRELASVYPEADISLSYDLNHLNMVRVDSLRMGRVFANILGNALQAMREKGILWFRTTQQDAFVEFSLGNAGSLIPPENLPKLFDAFFTSGKKGGTGLGLAIAKKVVEAHGGSIRCESKEETGTEFIFTLPSSSQKAAEKIALPKHLHKLGHASLSGNAKNEMDKPLSIAIIEDSDTQFYLFQKALVYHANVVHFKTPEAFEACYCDFNFDIVITDQNFEPFSKRKGLDFAKRLRHELHYTKPIILASLESFSQDKTAAIVDLVVSKDHFSWSAIEHLLPRDKVFPTSETQKSSEIVTKPVPDIKETEKNLSSIGYDFAGFKTPHDKLSNAELSQMSRLVHDLRSEVGSFIYYFEVMHEISKAEDNKKLPDLAAIIEKKLGAIEPFITQTAYASFATKVRQVLTHPEHMDSNFISSVTFELLQDISDNPYYNNPKKGVSPTSNKVVLDTEMKKDLCIVLRDSRFRAEFEGVFAEQCPSNSVVFEQDVARALIVVTDDEDFYTTTRESHPTLPIYLADTSDPVMKLVKKIERTIQMLKNRSR